MASRLYRLGRLSFRRRRIVVDANIAFRALSHGRNDLRDDVAAESGGSVPRPNP